MAGLHLPITGFHYSQPRLKATNSLQKHQLRRPRNQIFSLHGLRKLLKLLRRPMSLDGIHVRITAQQQSE